MYLELENIRKAYDGKVAVENLSLSVPKGVLYGIIGPNGSGKTTTIRMVMNIIAPDSGRVLIDGKPADQSFLDRVGYLPEGHRFPGYLTARQTLSIFGRMSGVDRATLKRRIP